MCADMGASWSLQSSVIGTLPSIRGNLCTCHEPGLFVLTHEEGINRWDRWDHHVCLANKLHSLWPLPISSMKT